jgi:hypothetical protein
MTELLDTLVMRRIAGHEHDRVRRLSAVGWRCQ